MFHMLGGPKSEEVQTERVCVQDRPILPKIDTGDWPKAGDMKATCPAALHCLWPFFPPTGLKNSLTEFSKLGIWDNNQRGIRSSLKDHPKIAKVALR